MIIKNAIVSILEMRSLLPSNLGISTISCILAFSTLQSIVHTEKTKL